ncbi:MAG: hypothetical protein RL722_1109, partial [Pseudomonadota bacterium]
MNPRRRMTDRTPLSSRRPPDPATMSPARRPFRLSLLTGLLLGGLAQAQTLPGAVSGGTGPAPEQPFRTDQPGFQPRVGGSSERSAGPQVLADGLYAANRAIGQIKVEVRNAGAPADGVTPVHIRVEVLDAAGVRLDTPVLLTLEHSGSARLLLPGALGDESSPGRKDADRQVPGTQLRVEHGEASFSLIAPSQPEEVRLRVSGGDVEVAGSISFVPDLREMVAAGVVEGVLRLSRTRGASAAILPAGLDDGFETELRRWSRRFDGGNGQAELGAALFLKGKISGDTLLSLAYDSDKDMRATQLRDIKPEEFYPVYGDSAVRGFDARSSSHLYVRVDRNRSYVLWGDFNTAEGYAPAAGGGLVAGSRLRQLGAYNRNVTGARLHSEGIDWTGNVYASRDTQRLLVEEVRANGTSGPFAVGNTQAVELSERIELLVRDRNDLNTVLSVTPLQRLNDYSFEPFSGRILLNRPVPSITSEGNPVSLRISYEIDQGGDPYWLMGADGQVNIGQNLTVGGVLVNDQNPVAPFKLASVNTGLRLGPHLSLAVEAAQTEGVPLLPTTTVVSASTVVTTFGPPTTAVAGRLQLDYDDPVAGRKASLWVNRAETGFANPAGGALPGAEQRGASASLPLGETRPGEPATLSTRLDARQIHDTTNDARREGLSGELIYRVSPALQLNAGLRHIEESGRISGATASLGGNPEGGSAFGNGLGGGFTGAGSTTLINNNSAGIGGTVSPGSAPGLVPDLSASTAFAGLQWKATPRLTLQAQHEESVSGDAGRRDELGASYQLAERTRLYLRGQNQNGLNSRYGLDPAASQSEMALGLDSSYLPGASLFSEYRLRDAVDGPVAQVATGVRNAWTLSPGVVLTTGAERLKFISGSGQEATALTLGGDYTASERWKASGRLEWRRLEATPVQPGQQAPGTPPLQDSLLSTLTVARKLDRDWTLLTRNYYLGTDNHGSQPDGWQDRWQIGAAYRPVDNNRFDAFGKLEFKAEDNINGGGEWRRVQLAAVQTNLHPSRPWWWSGRLAGKHVAEQFTAAEGGARDSYRAWLASTRLIYDITERVDLGLLASVMHGSSPLQGS